MSYKWEFHNANNSDNYTFEINPNEMTSPFATKQINMQTTTAINGNVLMAEGARVPTTWTFSGTILSQTQYDDLLKWFNKHERIKVKDHFDRTFWILLTEYKVEPKRTQSHPWRHTYEVTALVITEPANP